MFFGTRAAAKSKQYRNQKYEITFRNVILKRPSIADELVNKHVIGHACARRAGQRALGRQRRSMENCRSLVLTSFCNRNHARRLAEGIGAIFKLSWREIWPALTFHAHALMVVCAGDLGLNGISM